MSSDAEHYAAIASLQARGVESARLAWAEVDPNRLTWSWTRLLPFLGAVIGVLQTDAALEGATYGASGLAEQGDYVAPKSFVDVEAFSGWTSDGAPLESLLYTPTVTVKDRMTTAGGLDSAMFSGRSVLEQIVTTQLADAARSAASVDIATRPGVGYTRFLNPPSCSRCVVLAGKFFRWNAGFRRHPRCDCVHRLTKASSLDAAKAEGLISDPYAYFHSLSPAEQARTFSPAGARAIADGADIFQVINANRGMKVAGADFTSEGTGRRGNAARSLRPGQRRMTPAAIYRLNPNRADALKDLEHFGYVLPGGQNPTGVLVGQREGAGALGRGGLRRAASSAVAEARRTGVRDPRSRYTMTEAERRLFDAKRDYDIALSGVSPYSSPGFGNTPDPQGLGLNRVAAGSRKVTATELATAERHYRRMLATGGQRFIE